MIFHSTYDIYIELPKFTLQYHGSLQLPTQRLTPYQIMPHVLRSSITITGGHVTFGGGYPKTSITMVLMVIKGAHPIWDGMNF